MERWQRTTILILAFAVVAFGIFSAGYAVGDRSADPVLITGSDVGGAGPPSVIARAFQEILDSAIEPPSEEALARAAVKGMIEALKGADDPYAYFYSPKAFADFQQLTTGRFSGIGVWLKVKEGKLEVVSVLPGTPALAAGLRRGDVILEVDDESLDELTPAESDAVVNMIKGPEGTDVELLIERAGRTLPFQITRAEIELPSLQSRMTSEDLGYIQLLGFAREAGRQVRDEVKSLEAKGAEGIILDLRDNGGGLFPEAVEVASVFIEKGPVVIYRSARGDDVEYDAKGDAFDSIPLVVLVNEGTASASEIVAGALQDRDRGVIIGVQTYGKGSVQEVVPLPDDSALKFTTAAYLTPSGRNINGKGIAPDIEIDAPPDRQLARAVEVLQGMILSMTGGQG